MTKAEIVKDEESKRQTGRTTAALRDSLARAICGEHVVYAVHTEAWHFAHLLERPPLAELARLCVKRTANKLTFASGGTIRIASSASAYVRDAAAGTVTFDHCVDFVERLRAATN